jgi:hypothetical protein
MWATGSFSPATRASEALPLSSKIRMGTTKETKLTKFQKVEFIERTTRRMAGSTITPPLIFANFR